MPCCVMSEKWWQGAKVKAGRTFELIVTRCPLRLYSTLGMRGTGSCGWETGGPNCVGGWVGGGGMNGGGTGAGWAQWSVVVEQAQHGRTGPGPMTDLLECRGQGACRGEGFPAGSRPGPGSRPPTL